MLTLKIKVILPEKINLFKNSRKLQLRTHSYGKTIGKFREQMRGIGKLAGAVLNRVRWRKLEV